MDKITITIPLPDASLSPNSRSHWGTKARHTQNYRAAAMLATKAALKRERPPGWLKAECQVSAFYSVMRRRDTDNLIASLKSAFDGIADTGVISNDSGLIHLPAIIGRDVKNPRIEITITGIPHP
jgi:Holliday junction resolvase RusA-like endonuclease